MKKLAVFSSALLAVTPAVLAAETDSTGPPPPMGWNSWNWFGKKDINEKVVREVIDAMVAEGLRDAGYKYVIVDGGWRTRSLSPKGELEVHPEKFPGGIKVLADYAHSKGMKFGLHTVPGTHDCGGDQVGGFGHEKTHVRQFKDWGCDFVKVDKCMLRGVAGKEDGKGNGGWTEEILEETYGRWRSEMDEQAPDMVLSISAYKFRDWYPKNCRIARTTLDIRAKIHKGGAQFDKGSLSVMGIADQNDKYAPFAGSGYWNDPDILAVGEQGMSPAEQRTHFALWCVMSAPLMLGNDPRNMSEEEKETILNADAIMVDQDTTEQGVRIKKEGDLDLWMKKLSGDRVAVLMINRHAENPLDAKLNLKELKLSGEFTVKDIFGKKNLENISESKNLQVLSHDCRFLLLTPKSK